MKPTIRKETIIIEEIRMDMGRPLDTPVRKCAAIAVVRNPLAGKSVEDLSGYGAFGKELGEKLLQNAMEALGVDADGVHSYGKAAVTGLGGEQEQGAAILHLGFDDAIRKTLPGAVSIVPSSEKAGPAGCTIDVPVHHKKAMKIRTHYDAMEVFVQDAPRDDEILVVLCLTTGGRPHPRIGGLLLQDAVGVDGVN